MDGFESYAGNKLKIRMIKFYYWILENFVM
jgi:hypothetical protein